MKKATDQSKLASCIKILIKTIKILILIGLCLLTWPSEPSNTHKSGSNEAYISKFTTFPTVNTLSIPYHNFAHKVPTAATFFWLDSPKVAPNHFLCKLGIEKRCTARETAEVVHLVVGLHILYTLYQDSMPILYNKTIDFQNYLRSYGITILLLETIRTELEQHYVATEPGREPWEIQMKNDEYFYKRENLVNVAVKKLDDSGAEYEYLLWIDAHQVFENPYWWHEAIIKCEKYTSVQLFQSLTYLGEGNSTALSNLPAFNFISRFSTNVTEIKVSFWGNAWAVRKEIFHAIKGLPDTCIAAFCDGCYVLAATDIDLEKYGDYFSGSLNYLRKLTPWILEARPIFKEERTAVRGRLVHFEHERSMKYFIGIRYMDKLSDRIDLREGKDLVRRDDLTLEMKNKELNAVFKILSTYTRFKDPDG